MKTVLLAAALIGAVVAAMADVAGYGDGYAFGRLQCAGTFGGLILAMFVPWFRFSQRRRELRPMAVDGVVVERREQVNSDRRHVSCG